VVNPDILVHEQELVYMGGQGGTRSSILANFDFSFDEATVPRDMVAFPDSLFTVNNIKTVKFSLVKPRYYHAFLKDNDGEPDRDTPTGQPVDLYYLVKQLEDPFELTAYEGWENNEVPPTQPRILNTDFFEPNVFDEPFLVMDPADFVRWFDAGQPIGIIVQLDDQSDPGLVGYGSMDLTRFSEFDDLQVGTIVAPNFVVKFDSTWVGDNQFYLMAPYADTSTFDEVPQDPAAVDNGFLLRTGLRSYPSLNFDLSALPPSAFINRALLSVFVDTTISYGNLSSIAVLEWDVARFGDPYRTMELSELRDADPIFGSERYSFHVIGQRSLDPLHQGVIQFDVTQAILRIINQVYTGTRGLILTGAENFLPEGVNEVDPDFYYREFRFMGTAAADQTHRPQLKITYSVVNELNGEGK
jgi:hypothetical protein